MRKRKKITAKLGLVLLLLAALAMILLPFQAWATDNDTDNDGILDTEEGQCLPLDASNCSNTNINIPDLFVLLKPASPSMLSDIPDPFDPFEFIERRDDILLHVIGPGDTSDQKISQNEYAVLLIEDTRTSDGDLGTSLVGTPSTPVSGRFYPQRILDDVVNACNYKPGYSCEAVAADPLTGAEPQVASDISGIFNFYVQNVIAHETFHMLDRVVPGGGKKIGPHYDQQGYIMDAHMFYKVSRKNKTVTWHITNQWAAADVPRFK